MVFFNPNISIEDNFMDMVYNCVDSADMCENYSSSVKEYTMGLIYAKKALLLCKDIHSRYHILSFLFDIYLNLNRPTDAHNILNNLIIEYGDRMTKEEIKKKIKKISNCEKSIELRKT